MAGPIRLKIGLIHCVTHFKITNLFDDAKDMNQKSDILYMFFVLHRCTYIINYKQAYFTVGCEVNLAVKAFNYLSRKKKMKSTLSDFVS